MSVPKAMQEKYREIEPLISASYRDDCRSAEQFRLPGEGNSDEKNAEDSFVGARGIHAGGSFIQGAPLAAG